MIFKLFTFVAMATQCLGQSTPPSPPMDLSIVKCFWLVFGEFNYDQAKSACAIRNGTMATFNSPSEDHVVRYRIDWDTVPGYQEGKEWIGQLWLGAKRAEGEGNEWMWNTATKKEVPFSFATWIGDPETQSQDGQDCVVLQEDGWTPARCDALIDGSRYPAGALCETITGTGPDSDVQAASTNFCDVPLMPASQNNLPLPIVLRKTYFLIKGNFTWDGAAEACAESKGTLATLKSNIENEFIFKNIDLSFVDMNAWIGLKRTNTGSRLFRWVDGFTNSNQYGFLPGQPDNAFGGNQDCIAFMKNDIETIGWADLPCEAYGTPEAGRALIGALCESFVLL